VQLAFSVYPCGAKNIIGLEQYHGQRGLFTVDKTWGVLVATLVATVSQRVVTGQTIKDFTYIA
jgi:hypothetical protein